MLPPCFPQPHLCNWRTETNTEQFATYRILLRRLFAGVRGAAFQVRLLGAGDA